MTATPARRLRTGVALAALCALVACAGRDHATLRFGLATAPVTLDPRYATDAVSTRLVRLLYRPLVRFDASGRPVPDLGRWRRLDPGHYRFRLDPDATFSDGRPVTARDVVATYRSVLDPALASPLRGSLANVRAIRSRGLRTVDFRLAQPDPLFPGTLVVGIVPAAAVAGGRRLANQAGSGPFALVSRHGDGTLVLRRRRDGARVEFVTVRDATVRAVRLASGDLDIIQGDIPPELFAWLGRQPGLVARRVRGATFSYLGFNLARSATARRAVRLAVAEAIDRRPIIAAVFRGNARPASAVFPPEHWAGARHLSPPPYDPAHARALLHEAGIRGRLTLHFKTSTDYFRLRLAQILRSQLAAVGIDLDIQSLDWGTFYGDIRNGAFQVYGLSWVGLELPDLFRYAFHSTSTPPVGANRGRLNDPVVDRLIESAEREGDLGKRPALYRAIEQRLLYDLPYVPLWFEDQLVVRRAGVVGYRTDANGNFDALAGTTWSRERTER